MSKGKPKILMVRTDWSVNEFRKKNDLYGGIGYYRVIKPAQYLSEHFDIDVIGQGFEALGRTQEQRMRAVFTKYDLIYMRQIDNARTASDFLACSEHFGVPMILDLDDNLFAIRRDNPGYHEYHPGSQRSIILKVVSEMSAGMVVSTDPLKKVFKKINSSIDVLPNMNDINDWQYEKKKWNDKIIRIGWAGSLTHDVDLMSIIEPMKVILSQNPNVEFHLAGGVSQEKISFFRGLFKPYDHQVKFFAGTPAWEGYPQLMANFGWDIAIAPLVDDEFNRSKSHIKWMEYSMYQIPVVASKTYPYHEKVQGLKTIQDGKTGLLAQNDADWIEALTLLINNVTLREQIGYNAYDYIKKNWQWKDNIDKWVKVFKKYL